MADGLRLYLRYAAASVRSQMQYRASFLMQTLGQFIGCIIEFVGIWALLSRFGSLGTWTLPEIGLLYGLANTAYAVTDGLSRGFDVFGNTVRNGEFDRLLLRPRSTVLQLAGQELTLRRIGRFAQGALVMGWALCALDVAWTPGKVLLLAAGLVSGILTFYGLLILQATMCFWTTESLEIMNVLTYGGIETARYPMHVYAPWFRRFFIYVVPLAAMSYFPAVVVLDKPDVLGFPEWFHRASPLLGAVFFAASLRVWRFGIRRYRSTGS